MTSATRRAAGIATSRISPSERSHRVVSSKTTSSKAASSKTAIFTYREALEVFPEVQRLTREAVAKIAAMSHRLRSREELEQKRTELEAAAEATVAQWQRHITALGCLPKEAWLVDWDCGDGYYCWQYPEPTIAHFQGYNDGFEGRVPIQ